MSTLVQKPTLSSSCRVAAQTLAVTICIVLVGAVLTGSTFLQSLWWILLIAGVLVGFIIVKQAFNQDCQAYAWWKLIRILFSVILSVIIFTIFT